MTSSDAKGVDSGFIELAQEQLDGVEARLGEIEVEMENLSRERGILLNSRLHLQGLVGASNAANDGVERDGKLDVQATRDAVVDLIRAHGRPMHFRDEIYPSLAAAGHKIGGQDPASTLLSRMIDDERLHRTGRGEYGLAEWSDRVLSPAFGISAAKTSGSKAIAAAVQILRDAGETFHYREIARRTLRGGMWETSAKEPDAAMLRALLSDIEKHGDKSSVIKIRPGIFGLRGRDEADV